jgi:hypothetical protein
MWAHQDLNLDRVGYEPMALPLSYGPELLDRQGGRTTFPAD